MPAGNDLFRQRYPVIRQKHDLELAVDAGVRIDARPDHVDRANDVLGEVIARCGLGRKNEDTRHHVEVRLLQQPPVERHDVEQIQVLPLVFVQTLDLHVEECIRRDLDAAFSPDDLGQIDLVGAFDRHELPLERRVGGVGLEPRRRRFFP